MSWRQKSTTVWILLSAPMKIRALGRKSWKLAHKQKDPLENSSHSLDEQWWSKPSQLGKRRRGQLGCSQSSLDRVNQWLFSSEQFKATSALKQTMGKASWVWVDERDTKSLTLTHSVWYASCRYEWREMGGGAGVRDLEYRRVWPREKSLGALSLYLGFEARRKSKKWGLAGRTSRGEKRCCLRTGPSDCLAFRCWVLKRRQQREANRCWGRWVAWERRCLGVQRAWKGCFVLSVVPGLH